MAPDEEKIECPYCQQMFKRSGLGNHKKACKRKLEEGAQEAELRARLRAAPPKDTLPAPRFAALWETGAHTGRSLTDGTPGHTLVDDGDTTTDVGDMGNDFSPARNHEDDDIRVEYHPNSGRTPDMFKINQPQQSEVPSANLPAESEPWAPFCTREDFEFAKIALDTGMTKDQMTALIKLFKKCVEGDGKFTISGVKELMDKLSTASNRLTKFEKQSVTPKYQDKERKYDVWVRPIMKWAEEMLQDENLIHHFVWDAQRVSKFDSKSGSWVRVYDEPWTADHFWEVQTNLPKGSKPLTFCVFSDKTKLSSFGTQKAYPVIARCTNLPVKLRNGSGMGGGRIVGWLPIVEEEAGESGKKEYVNFKRVVWHESFIKLLDSIQEVAKTGLSILCADGVTRHLYPIILILSADHEEQCFMALVQGISGKFPCPVCLVPKNQRCDGSTHPHRTAERMQQIYHEARALPTKTEQDKLLKSYGLRNVENVFWSVPNSDPYQALSFDRLHTNHLGLFKDHLWKEVKVLVGDLGRQKLGQVDKQIINFPWWRGIVHFSSGAMGVTFSDGSTFKDLSKISIFVLHNIFKEKTMGYLLLKVLRCYVEIDSYAGLKVHTEKTIALGKEKLTSFYQLIGEYIAKRGDDGLCKKSWDFPKIHALLHLFDDIVTKGATRNYSTKPNESLNQPLKGIYLTQTNFRDVVAQILRIEHLEYVISFIYEKIKRFDEKNKHQVTTVLSTGVGAEELPHFHLGSLANKEEKLSQLTNSAGSSIPNLSNLVEAYINKLRTAEEGYYRVQKDHMVRQYHYLQVTYKSMVNWQNDTDYLCCNDSFFGHPRFDYIIIDIEGRSSFAQLQSMFKIQAGTHTHTLVLVQTYGRPPGNIQRKDKDLGLHRVRVRSSPYKIIPIESIVRGAVLVEDVDNKGDYFVVDTIDGDMFLRLAGFSL